MDKDDSSPLTRDIAPFGLRMPPDLKDRVQASAKANNRSMNAEIVAALLERYPAPPDRDIDALVELAMKTAPDELERFILEMIERQIKGGTITERDIADGLVPGIALKRDP